MHVQEEQQQPKRILQTAEVRPEVPSSSPTFLSDDASDPDEEVPEEISNRILSRILIFAGIPTFTGILSLPLFYYLKVYPSFLCPSLGLEPTPMLF